jgi:hypothetical protein
MRQSTLIISLIASLVTALPQVTFGYVTPISYKFQEATHFYRYS